MEEALHCRSSLDSNLRPNCPSVQEDFCLLRDSSSTASDSGAFSGTTDSVGGNESSRETLKSSPLLNNRREQRAYITHLDRSEKERERKRKKENENTNTDADKKYITNLDRHSAKDRATLLAPTPQSSPKKSPKTSRSLGKSQSKDPGKNIRVQKKQNTRFEG